MKTKLVNEEYEDFEEEFDEDDCLDDETRELEEWEYIDEYGEIRNKPYDPYVEIGMSRSDF